MIAALVAAAVLVLPGQIVEPPPLADITYGADATAPATRLDPPPPPAVETTAPAPTGSTASAGGRCIGWEPLLAAYTPGWDVPRMSRIMYRESRCLPTVRNPSGATGLLQLMPAHCRWLAAVLGGCSVRLLEGAAYNIRAAAALWTRQGYRAWAL